MSCEMISSRKIDYYVNDPYVTIIDIRLKEKYVYSRIKGAIHYEYNKLVDDINNIYKCGKISYEFRKIFGNKEKIYIFTLRMQKQMLLKQNLLRLRLNWKR